jgi:lipopolysaccharide/colanic/teichoic acid biosynthesis glycosyltransferase
MLKRIFDIFFSLFALLVFLPFGLILAIIIVLESRGGVFYKQERIGQFGKPFYLFKFRSMKTGSDKKGLLTVGMNDSRITKSGFFIRKFKLDEMPQFINVLKGEMSIVGPRPEVRKYVDLYTKEQKSILNVKPGITDYASLEYFNENEILGKAENPETAYITEVMPDKILINQKYLKNPNLLQDLKIIGLTIMRIVFSAKI